MMTTKAAPPAGQRPPPIRWGRIIVRLILLVIIGLLAASEPILRWADRQPVVPLPHLTMPALGGTATPTLGPTPATKPGASGTTQAQQRPPLATIAAITRLVLRPPGRSIPLGIVIVGLGLCILDLLRAACHLVWHTLFARQQGHTHLRVRVPQQVGIGAARTGDTGADLLRALHGTFAGGTSVRGIAPWLTLTLHARPDEPAELSITVAGGTVDARRSWAAAVRKTVQGIAPEALIEPVDDPLDLAATTGRVVLARTWRARLGPAFPMRLHDDRAGGDLLGPLAAALAPRHGVALTMLQVTLQPRTEDADVEFTHGWRATALRRYLRLTQKGEHALSPDAKALETKLAGPVFDTTLHTLAVAEAPSQVAAARAELDELAAVLRQYAARSGSQLQRWRRTGNTHIVVSPATTQRRAVMGRVLTLIVGAGMGFGAWLLLREAVLTLRGIHYGLLPLPPAILARLPWLLSGLLPLLVTLVVLRLGAWVRGVPAARRLHTVRAAVPRATPPARVFWIAPGWAAPSILGAAEVCGLWHLPTPALGNLIRALPCRYMPPPPHAFLVPGEKASDGERPQRLVLGIGRHRDGTEAPIGLPLRDARQGLAFTAPPGVGKTQLASNLADQLRPCGFTLIDGKGDDAGNLVETMRHLIPREDEGRLLLLDVLDADWPVGINPLAGVNLHDTGAVDMVLGQIEGIFGRLDPETWARAPRMKNYLRKATLLVLYGEAHPTLAHVKQCLLDHHYRERLLPSCPNVEVRDFWAIEFPRMGDQQRSSLDALVSRFDMLLDSELTRYLFNAAHPLWSFDEAIAKRWVVLAPLAHRALGGLAGPVGMLLFQALMRAAFRRPGSDQTRPEYGFIGDEFQVLVENADTKDVRDALTQVRSFGIVTIIANQLLTQLGDLTEYALTAISNRMVLRTQEPDATIYARHYAASGVTAQDISGQEPREHQYAWLGVNGQLTKLFSYRPLPWLSPRTVTVPPQTDTAWQRRIPPNSPCPQFDQAICTLMYDELQNASTIARALADATDDHWQTLMARWDALRRYQHQWLCDHPGCIPDRLERQQWLSRLRGARRRVIAEAEYARIRRAIDPAEAKAASSSKVGATGIRTTTTASHAEPAPTNFGNADPDPGTRVRVLDMLPTDVPGEMVNEVLDD